MRILLDHCIDWRLRRSLPNHTVTTAQQMGWEDLKNGRLLAATGAAGFEVFLTVDQNIKAEQNLRKLPVAVIVFVVVSNRLRDLLPLIPTLQTVLLLVLPGQLIEVRPDGFTIIV